MTGEPHPIAPTTSCMYSMPGTWHPEPGSQGRLAVPAAHGPWTDPAICLVWMDGWMDGASRGT